MAYFLWVMVVGENVGLDMGRVMWRLGCGFAFVSIVPELRVIVGKTAICGVDQVCSLLSRNQDLR